jgi:hypothetical protein
MTPKDEQLKAWQETCIDYIQRAESAEALHKIGLEIGDTKVMVGAKSDDLTLITAAYLKRQRELKNQNTG